MFRYLAQIALAALALGVASGCQTTAPASPGTAAHLPPGPVLVLPVLAAHERLGDAARDLTGDLRQEMTARLGSRAVFAEDLTSLRKTMTPSNLCRDGQLAWSEIATLAQVGECPTAFVVVLEGRDSYMPQTLTAKATLVDAATAAGRDQRVATLDLADPAVAAAYRYYLENVRTFRVGNLESAPQDRLHTALLSPALFNRFAAYAIVNDLFADGDSAPAIQLRGTTPSRLERWWQRR